MLSSSILSLILLSFFPPSTHAARAPQLLNDSWTPLPDYPIPVLEAGGATVLDDRARPHLVVLGGYISNSGLQTTSAVHALRLDTSSASWQPLSPMPRPLTHVAQAAVGSLLYVCGGFLGTFPGGSVADCFVFDLPNNIWKGMPSLPDRRAGGAMVYVSQKNALLYASGTLRKHGEFIGNDKPDCWMLSLENASNGWMPVEDMPNPRNHMAATSVGGRYYFLGGQHENRETTDNQATVQEYDIWSGEWVLRKPMPVPVGHVSASTRAFWDGILVVGGINDGRVLSNRVHYYDIFEDTWTLVGSYPRDVQSPVCDKADRTLFCATGEGKPGSSQAAYSCQMSVPEEVLGLSSSS